MATFQNARDGVKKLVKDTAGKVDPTDLDEIIKDSVKEFGRSFPRQRAIEIAGDGGFDYPLSLLTGFVEDVSRIDAIFHPFDEDVQAPEELEPKDFRIFRKASGSVLRFLRASPGLNTIALVQYTSPHTADPVGVDVVAELTPAATAIAGASTSAVIDVESAADGRIFLDVTAAAGLLDVFIQTSEDGVDWVDVAAFNAILAVGKFVHKLAKEKLSKNVRLRYATAGAFTLGAQVERENNIGTLTVKDEHLDILSILCAAKTARALANFYAGTSDGTLEGDTTEYTGKSQFWAERADEWQEKYDEEIQTISGNDELPASATGEWDLMGSTGWRPQLHHPRTR